MEEEQKERKRMKILERLYVNDYILGKTQVSQSQTQLPKMFSLVRLYCACQQVGMGVGVLLYLSLPAAELLVIDGFRVREIAAFSCGPPSGSPRF